jgi:hypothetical protein
MTAFIILSITSIRPGQNLGLFCPLMIIWHVSLEQKNQIESKHPSPLCHSPNYLFNVYHWFLQRLSGPIRPNAIVPIRRPRRTLPIPPRLGLGLGLLSRRWFFAAAGGGGGESWWWWFSKLGEADAASRLLLSWVIDGDRNLKPLPSKVEQPLPLTFVLAPAILVVVWRIQPLMLGLFSTAQRNTIWATYSLISVTHAFATISSRIRDLMVQIAHKVYDEMPQPICRIMGGSVVFMTQVLQRNESI